MPPVEERKQDFDKNFEEFWNEKAVENTTEKKEAEWQYFASSYLKKRFHFRVSRFQKYAATILVLFTVCASVIYFSNLIFPSEIGETIVSNSGDKIKVFTLPDSTRVRLQPYSEITYANNFKTNRTIALSGKAFFTVKKDKKHPFKVTCLQTVTTVLGTSFTIQQHTTDKKVCIKLYEGSIKMNIKGDTKNWLLSPGEEIISVGKEVKLINFNRFKDFNNTSVQEFIEYLELHYSYKIEIPKKYLAQSITLRIRKEEIPEIIFKTIAEIYDLEFIINNTTKKVVFHTKPQ